MREENHIMTEDELSKTNWAITVRTINNSFSIIHFWKGVYNWLFGRVIRK